MIGLVEPVDTTDLNVVQDWVAEVKKIRREAPNSSRLVGKYASPPTQSRLCEKEEIVVWLGVNKVSREVIVVKNMLVPARGARSRVAAREQEGIELLRAIQRHPGIVRLHMVQVLEHNYKHLYMMAMEYGARRDLQETLMRASTGQMGIRRQRCESNGRGRSIWR